MRRDGVAGIVELRNPRHLNAEDATTLAATEAAVDLVLLDPEIEVGVFRGGVVDHPRYAGGASSAPGSTSRTCIAAWSPSSSTSSATWATSTSSTAGSRRPSGSRASCEDSTEKLWIAAAETYAIGGACQLLHVMDHVIAERGCRLYLPARKEGIIPGASNMRLARAVGDRIARQAILSGREFEAGTPDGDLLCDEVVEPGEMDAAMARRVELLTSSGLVNAAANRRMMRVGDEPLDVFRAYMALYAREQAFCHFSPALIANLERHWDARNRRL